MKPHLWVIEVNQDGYWEPTNYVYHSRQEARNKTKLFKNRNVITATRIRKYTPVN